MATGETSHTTEAAVKKPFYRLPKFTSQRWAEGIYDVEQKACSESMYIREEDLLSFDQRVEVETRSLIFRYQLKYAEKEYELLRKEFKNIEEKLSQPEVSDDEFVKPEPVDKRGKKHGKSGKQTKSQSGSETEGASANEPDVSKVVKRRGMSKTKSDSETSADEPVAADDTKDARKVVKTRSRFPKKSDSETDITSSTEGPPSSTEPPRVLRKRKDDKDKK